jgi:hypothetical protein
MAVEEIVSWGGGVGAGRVAGGTVLIGASQMALYR